MFRYNLDKSIMNEAGNIKSDVQIEVVRYTDTGRQLLKSFSPTFAGLESAYKYSRKFSKRFHTYLELNNSEYSIHYSDFDRAIYYKNYGFSLQEFFVAIG